MRRSLISARWLTALAILAGGSVPAVSLAQVKLHLNDQNAIGEESPAVGTEAIPATVGNSKIRFADGPSALGSESLPGSVFQTRFHVGDRGTGHSARLESYSQRDGQVPSPSANDPAIPSTTDPQAKEAAEYWMVDDACCPTRNWFEADYLLWWTSGNALPALVTTSPAGTIQTEAGVLDGGADVSVLFGNDDIDDGDRSGMRFTLGHWADAEGTIGVQATYFSVFDDNGSGDFSARTTAAIGAGTGAPILARPFFNVAVPPNDEDARLISFPGVVDGSINITSQSEFHSIGVLLRQHFRSGTRGRMDMIGGYRYFRFREHLLIQESLTTTDPAGAAPIGTTFAIEDLFEAANDFHGGDMGVQVEFWRGYWTFDFLAKVAIGNLHRSAKILGSTTIDTPPAGGGVTTGGGLLAQPTNMGSFTANDFAVLPEFGANLKFAPHDNLSVQLGYSLLFLADIQRTGDLIDRGVNATQFVALVGAARPASQFANTSDFWAQGLNFGVTIRR